MMPASKGNWRIMGEVPAIPCRFTGHAREQMAARNVPEAGVLHVLVHYHTHRPAQPRVNNRPSDIYIGDFEGKRLKIYVERDSDPLLIKTVAWADD